MDGHPGLQLTEGNFLEQVGLKVTGHKVNAVVRKASFRRAAEHCGNNCVFA